MRPIARIALLAVLLLLVGVSAASGFAEGDVTYSGGGDCIDCHFSELPFTDRVGPHGGYSSITDKCAVCHDIHDGPSPIHLLPAATIRDTCMVCHDGSGGYGVYGTLAARGVAVGAIHRIDTTTIVPGGDAGTGGDASVTFGGEGGRLSCGDCHTPHDSNAVEPFAGERIRFHTMELGLGNRPLETTHLLKRRPTGATSDVAEYGSDWCLACHKGRVSGTTLHNHPVDSLATTATPFTYRRVAAVIATTSLETTFASLGLQVASPLSASTWSNRGFVMPTPRTAQQSGHAPICQQCHEDARDVGVPGAVAAAQVYRYGDGQTAGDAGTDSPLFQTFPHEGVNARFLVETDDNLCLNCHDPATLP